MSRLDSIEIVSDDGGVTRDEDGRTGAAMKNGICAGVIWPTILALLV
jgi:hypothetical protein